MKGLSDKQDGEGRLMSTKGFFIYERQAIGLEAFVGQTAAQLRPLKLTRKDGEPLVGDRVPDHAVFQRRGSTGYQFIWTTLGDSSDGT